MHPYEVDVSQLEEKRRAGAPLLDVRNPDEYEAARVPGAYLLPLGELIARQSEVPTGEPVFVICHSGVRSLKAVQYLRTQGIEAWSVAGGTKEWAESGRAVESGAA